MQRTQHDSLNMITRTCMYINYFCAGQNYNCRERKVFAARTDLIYRCIRLYDVSL